MQAELQTALFNAFDTLNLQQMKSFNVPPVTLHGVGALAACGPQAQSRGLRHLFVMVDSFLHQAGMTAGLERSLAMKGDCYDSLALSRRRTLRHRCCAAVAQSAGRALRRRGGLWWWIGTGCGEGGGAAGRQSWSRRWGDDGAQRVASTSAADRGADHRWHRVWETTNVTVIIDAVSGRKQVLAHASLMPDVAILDAALTEGVPPHITAMTGIDALTHAVEAYSARHATPFTDSLAMGAIAMIGRGAAESGGLRSGSGGAGEHAAGFLHGGDGVFQRRAGAMPCHGASAGGRRCIFRTVWPTPCCCQR